MGAKLKFGLLLPHFGAGAASEKCIAGAVRAEAYGFASVWVRDHLVFTPHSIEEPDNTHIEGLLVLGAVAAATRTVTIGTAMAICHRHPVHLAQSFAALSHLSRGRVIMGMSVGGFPHEFAAAGLPAALEARARLAKTNAHLCRRLWAGETISYRDEVYDFQNVGLKPTPIAAIPIWGGGSTPAACRRIAEYCDGWMPARITLATFEKRMDYLRELCRTAGRAMVDAAVMPLVSVAEDRQTALRCFHVDSLIGEANRNSTWVKPASGAFTTPADIEGFFLAGPPGDIIRGARAYREAGAEMIVCDLRFRFGDWLEQIDLLGKKVLPAF